MSAESGIEHGLTLGDNLGGLAVVDHGGREQAEPGVVMIVVVPEKEGLAEAARVFDRAEALRKVRPVFQRTELAFRIRVVVGDMRAGMRFDDAEVGQQMGHGLWDTSRVRGLPRQSLDAATPVDKPNLLIRPWHQSGNVVSLREFSNNAYHQHHGIQPVERFGLNSDPDGDGVMNEMTRADITAVSLYQASLQTPGRVIPRDKELEAAIWRGEQVFQESGCAGCHRPELPISIQSAVFEEPGPFNPALNVKAGDLAAVRMDLNSPDLPQPRLSPDPERPHLVYVPLYSDLKLHDITDANDPEAAEPLDQNETVWSPRFRKGNRMFLTKRLWGAANEPPYFHHGQFTTLRQAVLAHHGEAYAARNRFQKRSEYDQDSLIEFLKSLQVLPPGTRHLIVDENYQPRPWPPAQPLAAPVPTATNGSAR
jgi:hypothetical protein